MKTKLTPTQRWWLASLAERGESTAPVVYANRWHAAMYRLEQMQLVTIDGLVARPAYPWPVDVISQLAFLPGKGL